MMVGLSQLDPMSILVVGVVLVAGGSGGLLAVRLSNPRLRGLEWLGGAFAAGGVGALLLTGVGRIPRFFGVVLSDLLLLLAFVLVHVAILAIRRTKRLFPVLGAGLIVAQATSYWYLTYVQPDYRKRLAVVGLAVSIQAAQTVVVLLRGIRRGVRMPTCFLAGILVCFIWVNTFRSCGLMFMRAFQAHGAVVELETVTFVVFIATAVGVAFSFFWMTMAELSQEMEEMANTDPLTRIYNRRVFQDWCEREMAVSLKTGTPFSVLMMDLDHFKAINDRFGHRGGDQMLCAVVERMQHAIRGIDVLGRWGGEEFVALLPGAGADDALMVAQRVRGNVERLLLTVKAPGTRNDDADPMEVRMTLSLGVATFRGQTDQLEDLFHRADTALYRAKSEGRNRALLAA